MSKDDEVDKVFLRLKRCLFDDLIDELNCMSLINHNDRWRQRFLSSRGWTLKEFIEESVRRSKEFEV
jgi:hypothetical protein